MTKPKRITDRERLDFLQKEVPWADVYRECNTAQVVDHQGNLFTGKTLRRAIDAAIKQSRVKREGRC